MVMNVVKDVLRQDKAAIGVSASLNSPVEFLADSGYDFILFDTQHSAVEIKELQYQIKAMKGRRASPIVRVGENRQDQICYALDIGARGIIAPMINTKKEVTDMVNWCKYPPDGKRSNAGKRGEWGEFDNYSEYMRAVNEELLIIPMIETMESLSNMEDILSVPGVDVLLVGPSDLSINLGIPLDYYNPKYRDTLDKIAEACENAGVVPGMYFIPDGQDPSDFVDRGFKFFTLPWSGWATNGIKNGLASIKR
jgi:2-keto-3-deoxy-L-rhamnonate aldolase RhmA